MAGVLIEAELPFLLVGIGVNVRHKPEVPQQGADRGRPATCLGDFGADSTEEVGAHTTCSTYDIPRPEKQRGALGRSKPCFRGYRGCHITCCFQL